MLNTPLDKSNEYLNEAWIRAAFAGGLWASFEIIIGSFLHNIRMPFSGTILAAFSTSLMIAFYITWKDKHLIWRAGTICALMKSLSPSAVILGPLTGILMEAFLLFFVIYAFKGSYFSYILGGILSVGSALFHKIISLLIVYGNDIIELYINFYYFASKQVGFEHSDPKFLIFIFVGGYILVGVFAAIMGVVLAKSITKENPTNISKKVYEVIPNYKLLPDSENTNIFLLVIHILAFPVVFLIIEFSTYYYVAAVFMLLYIAFALLWYKYIFRRFKKTIFWIQLIILIVISTLFFENPLERQSFFSETGFWVGLKMVLRALFVVVAFSSISKELTNPIIENKLSAGRFKNLFHSIQISVQALPTFIDLLPKAKKILLHPIQSSSEMIAYASILIDDYVSQKNKNGH